jgi:hypothetical protein
LPADKAWRLAIAASRPLRADIRAVDMLFSLSGHAVLAARQREPAR